MVPHLLCLRRPLAPRRANMDKRLPLRCAGGDGGQATAAFLNGPMGIVFDVVGDLYIAGKEALGSVHCSICNFRISTCPLDKKTSVLTDLDFSRDKTPARGRFDLRSLSTLLSIRIFFSACGGSADTEPNVFADSRNSEVWKVAMATGIISIVVRPWEGLHREGEGGTNPCVYLFI